MGGTMSSLCGGKFGRVGVPICRSIGWLCAVILSRQPTAYVVDVRFPLNGRLLPAFGPHPQRLGSKRIRDMRDAPWTEQ